MNVYLIRPVGSNELSALLWARDLDELWDLMDEAGDPYAFEYTKLKTGGGFFYSEREAGEVQFNASKWEEEASPDAERPADVPEADWSLPLPEQTCEATSMAFWDMAEGKLKWKRFDSTDVGHGMMARIVRQREAEGKSTPPERVKEVAAHLGLQTSEDSDEGR